MFRHMPRGLVPGVESLLHLIAGLVPPPGVQSPADGDFAPPREDLRPTMGSSFCVGVLVALALTAADGASASFPASLCTEFATVVAGSAAAAADAAAAAAAVLLEMVVAAGVLPSAGAPSVRLFLLAGRSGVPMAFSGRSPLEVFVARAEVC